MRGKYIRMQRANASAYENAEIQAYRKTPQTQNGGWGEGGRDEKDEEFHRHKLGRNNSISRKGKI